MAIYQDECSRLPRDVWLRILSYADTDALLAMEAAACFFSEIVTDERLLASIVCAPSSNERMFERFFSTREVRKPKLLAVSNCIVASPEVILSWIGTCFALTDLRCVNCPLPFSGLVMLLMERLTYLQRLDWSFFGMNLSANHMRHFTAKYSDRVIGQLRTTYVEVACQGADNHVLLSFLLKRCIALKKLHLHALYGDFTEATAMCVGAATFAAASTPTLAYSVELDVLRGQQPFSTARYLRLLQLPSNCSASASSSANLVCLGMPTARASLSPTPSMSPLIEIPSFKEVTVAVINEHDVAYRLAIAAIERTWTHIEALTLVLLHSPVSGTGTSAGTELRAPLITLFHSCPAITELNLTSFHFTAGVDCCNILASVTIRLRALSLAPCGVNRKLSFSNLAKVSYKLEELDVRVNSDHVSLHCSLCSQPFQVRRVDAWILQQRSVLRRFTLFNVAEVPALDFIADLRPTELRLSFMANGYRSVPTYNFGYLHNLNENLQSLVLRDHASFCGLEFYQENLDVLSWLNHLSLDVSMPCEPERVRSFFNHITARLSALETLHLHYVTEDYCMRTLTWLRQPAWSSETSQLDRQPSGAMLADHPCIGCSMATFIGLAKPPHHGWNRV